MAFTEQQEYKLEILPNKVIQVRRSDIVLKDGEVDGPPITATAFVQAMTFQQSLLMSRLAQQLCGLPR